MRRVIGLLPVKGADGIAARPTVDLEALDSVMASGTD